MSYVVSTCMAAFCHGQDHPGGVPVPVRDICRRTGARKIRSSSVRRRLALVKHLEHVMVV